VGRGEARPLDLLEKEGVRWRCSIGQLIPHALHALAEILVLGSSVTMQEQASDAGIECASGHAPSEPSDGRGSRTIGPPWAREFPGARPVDFSRISRRLRFL
jgi:hypothetical protein